MNNKRKQLSEFERSMLSRLRQQKEPVPTCVVGTRNNARANLNAMYHLVHLGLAVQVDRRGLWRAASSSLAR